MAFSVFAEVPSYSVETVALGSLPTFVDTKSLLKDRKSTLKSFFSERSRSAPCVRCPEVPAEFWKNIDNNNRATEQIIGKMIGVINNLVAESPLHPNKTDVRIRA